MGLLVDGKWVDRWYPTAETGGRFVRTPTTFRDQVTAAGGRFPAAAGRYHLFVSLACPWASRTLIARVLKRLEPVVGVTVVEPVWGEQGWAFADGTPGPDRRPLGLRHLHELYSRARPGYTGRVTVPVLWDTATATIVNNESADIVRMFDGAFDAWADRSVVLYPAEHRAEIDRLEEVIYERVNDGVYRAGFASTQDAHREACLALFATLDQLEQLLSRRRYLVGDRPTEVDWRLFTTLIRFDAVYHGHFKCNLRRLVDYPALWAYTRDLYQTPNVAATVDFDHIKRHYYQSHRHLNPSGIVPVGPLLDLDAEPGRAGLGGPPA